MVSVIFLFFSFWSIFNFSVKKNPNYFFLYIFENQSKLFEREKREFELKSIIQFLNQNSNKKNNMIIFCGLHFKSIRSLFSIHILFHSCSFALCSYFVWISIFNSSQFTVPPNKQQLNIIHFKQTCFLSAFQQKWNSIIIQFKSDE